MDLYTQSEKIEICKEIISSLQNFQGKDNTPVNLFNPEYSFVKPLKQLFNEYIHGHNYLKGTLDFVEINKTGFAALDNDSPKTMNETQSFYCKINKPAPFKFYKLVVQNLKKLPEWHPGKGTPAWIFMDELFLN
jgi:hypothetical protein